MKPARPRVRTLMILVAIVAILLAAGRASERYRVCVNAAQSQQQSINFYAKLYNSPMRLSFAATTTKNLLADAKKQRATMLAYRAELAKQLRYLTLRKNPYQAEIASLDEKLKANEDWRVELQGQITAEKKRFEQTKSSLLQMIVYHARIMHEYNRASVRPWLRFPEIPPPPVPEERAEFYCDRALDHIKRGDFAGAIAAYEEAIRSAAGVGDEETLPEGGTLEARTSSELARILATCLQAQYRNGTRAVRLADRACELTGYKNPKFLDTLAVAYAEAGDFPSAIECQTKAIRLLAPGHPDNPDYRKRLALFHAQSPYREHLDSEVTTSP